MTSINQAVNASKEEATRIKRELIDLAPLVLRPLFKKGNNDLLENLLDKKEITFSISLNDYPNVRPSEFFSAVDRLPSAWGNDDEVKTNFNFKGNELEVTITLLVSK